MGIKVIRHILKGLLLKIFKNINSVYLYIFRVFITSFDKEILFYSNIFKKIKNLLKTMHKDSNQIILFEG